MRLRRQLVLTAIVGASTIAFVAPARSQMDNLSDYTLGGVMSPRGTERTAPNAFKKIGPYRIALVGAGVGNSWIVQSFEEAKVEVARHKDIVSYVQTNAEWQPAKQVSDLEDVLTKNVDAVILSTVTPTNANAEIEKFAAKKIPVVVLGTGMTGNYAVEVRGGAEHFGKVGGDFLVKALHGKGTVWAFRGIAGAEEEVARYNGFRDALKGTQITIGAEEYGDWNYAKSKQICQNLVLSGKPVDGIWFSGAEMTRACVDVFQQAHKPLVPMTGEGNNGFFRIWKETGMNSVAAVFPPSLPASAVRVTLALLHGESVPKHLWSEPAALTNDTYQKYYRPDLNDNYWVPSSLPDSDVKKLYAK